MLRSPLRRLLATALVALGLAAAQGARAQENFVPPLPQDFDKVDVYLLTIGRGPQIWALYGHTFLRVVDRSPVPGVPNALPRDWNFNWGIFDFNDPRFAWNFYRGDMTYMMVISDNLSLIDHYRGFEHRSMQQDRVVLTAKQKEALMKRLIANSQPENIHYKYLQFEDNCATRPRDHLDSALGGKIRTAYGQKPGLATFRHWIRTGARPVWWAELGLDSASNDRLDRPVTAWDEMFLPANLRHYLAQLPAYDDNGAAIPGRNLLEDHQVIIDLPEPQPGRDPYVMFAVLAGLPLIAIGIAAGGRLREKHAALLLGTFSLVFGLWSAFWGTFLAVNHFLSLYPELKHNASLWLFWPIDWLFVLFGLWLMVKRERLPRLARLTRAARFVASAHLTGLLVLALGWAVGLIHQEVLPVLGSSGVVALVFYGVVIRHAAAREP